MSRSSTSWLVDRRPPAPTASAASSVKPPANTASRRNSAARASSQEVVAPVDQRAQRLLARQRGAVAAGQQPEAIVQALGDLLDRQRAHARRGELDRERNAVEPPADVRRLPARSASVTRSAGCAAVARSTNRRTAANRVSASGVNAPARARARRAAAADTSSRPRRAAARGSTRGSSAAARPAEAACASSAQASTQMLAVVEDQQQPPVARRA